MPLVILDTDFEKARWVLSRGYVDLQQGIAEAFARERREAQDNVASGQSREQAMQELADQAQALDMGYGSADGQSTNKTCLIKKTDGDKK